MIGVEYFRHKNKLTRKALKELSGITTMTIMNYERKGIPGSAYVSSLLPVADALGITLDELVDEYDARDLSTQDRAARYSAIRSPHNAVSNYRIAHNLRYQELADRLGLGDRESARVACKRETARAEHVIRLAGYEQISAEEFLKRYLPADNGSEEG